MTPHIASVNVGDLRPLRVGGRMVASGIYKSPVDGPVWLGVEGMLGDVQGDRRHHGGPDKAVNVYPGENYDFWSGRLRGELIAGAFGENLTTSGLSEDEVAVGDVFRVGEALVQVSQPRQPCGTLAARHQEPNLVRWVYDSRKTGFYLRCLESGRVCAGDAIFCMDRSTPRVTVAEATAIMLDGTDCDAIQQLLAVRALSSAWRRELLARREG